MIDLTRTNLWIQPPSFQEPNGDINFAELNRYTGWLSGKNLDAVMLWHPSGLAGERPLEERLKCLQTWSSALGSDKFVITVITPDTNAVSFTEALQKAQELARLAQDSGASALVIQPPGSFNDDEQVWQKTFAWHQAILESVQIPGVLLQDDQLTGSLTYPVDLIDDLLTLPYVMGVWVQTFDSMTKLQDMAGVLRLHAEKRLIAGSDRCIGAALMSGADTIVSDTAAAFPEPVGELVRSYKSGQFDRFMKLHKIVDAFSQTVVREPMTSSSLRLKSALALAGVLEPSSASVPNGERLEQAELQKINTIMSVLKRRLEQID